MAKKTAPESGSGVPDKIWKRNYTAFCVILLIAGIIPAAYINFPAGDSWTHGWTVEQWINGNHELNDWSSALALPQQVAGWLFNLGRQTVSWTGLSILTWIVTSIGLLIAALLPWKLYPDKKQIRDWAPLFAITMLATSFTLKISAGFMTDGYYFLLLVIALWLLIDSVMAFRSTGGSSFFIKWILYAFIGMLAALQRSHGFLLLLLPIVWILITKIFPNKDSSEKHNKRWAWGAFYILVSGFVIAIAVNGIDSLVPARSAEVGEEVKTFWLMETMPFKSLLRDRWDLAFGIMQHLGWALMPVALIARLEKTRQEKDTGKKTINWWYVIPGAMFMLYTFIIWGSNGRMFPYLENSMTADGFGPREFTIALISGNKLPDSIRATLTLFGTGGGVILIYLLSRTVTLKNIDWKSPQALIGLIGLGHLGILFLNPHFFDRYLLPLLPFCLVWLAPILAESPARSRLGGWILVVLFMGFNLWGTRDSLDWTKSKWDLENELISGGIPSSSIVGGYEVDGYYNFSNENYVQANKMGVPVEYEIYGQMVQVPWWVGRLGLHITPDVIICENGSDVSGTPYEAYIKTDISNERMTAWVHLDSAGLLSAAGVD